MKGELKVIDRGYKTVTIDGKKFSYEGTPAEKFIPKIECPCHVEYSVKKGTTSISFLQKITAEQFNDPNYPPKKFPEGKSPFRPPPPPSTEASEEARSQFKTGTEVLQETSSGDLWECMTEGCKNPVTPNDRRISEFHLGTNVVLCGSCFKALRQAQQNGEKPEIPKPRMPMKFTGEIPKTSPEPNNSPESPTPPPPAQNHVKEGESATQTHSDDPTLTQTDYDKQLAQAKKAATENIGKKPPEKQTSTPQGDDLSIYTPGVLAEMSRNYDTYWKAKFLHDLKVGQEIRGQAALNTATEIVNHSPDCNALSSKERTVRIQQVARELMQFVRTGGAYEEVPDV